MNREIEWIHSASEISALENCWMVSLEVEMFYSMIWMTVVLTSEVLQICVKSCQNISHRTGNYKSNKQGEEMGTNSVLQQVELLRSEHPMLTRMFLDHTN